MRLKLHLASSCLPSLAPIIIPLLHLSALTLAHASPGAMDSHMMDPDMARDSHHHKSSSDHHHHHEHEHSASASSYPPSYFSHPKHCSAIYAHIALMVLAWVWMLPTAVMFSIAQSRYTLVAQSLFLTVNAVGLVIGMVYNAQTPDLYPNNAHHKLGWIVTAIVGAHVAVGLLARIAGAGRKPRDRSYTSSTSSSGNCRTQPCAERRSFIPVSQVTVAQSQQQHPRSSHHSDLTSPYRYSQDSGQGTEPMMDSPRIERYSSTPFNDNDRLGDNDDEDDFVVPSSPLHFNTVRKTGGFFQKIAGSLSTRSASKLLHLTYAVTDRAILILGFITTCTGIATFGRFFEGGEIFGGLAHWIKGGVFFWLGILCLSRWAGSFATLGWAWNLRPPPRAGKKWRPSAEFIESFLIFFYGSTNIFLEHLGNLGGSYSAEDFEHIAITVLFIGGGLLGMLVESVQVRDLLNASVPDFQPAAYGKADDYEEKNCHQPPRSYKFSTNPIPALVILLLGIMMSSHTQHNMVSSMIHKQWGNLLAGAAFARGLSYVLLYLKPPTSVLPSRPPTELLTAFGLMAGGLLFMASASDIVRGIINQDLDVMFMYTITMGLVGLLMAWVLVLLTLKGWAHRKELGGRGYRHHHHHHNHARLPLTP